MRPSYTRRQSARRRQLQLPRLRLSWFRLIVPVVVLLLVVIGIAQLTALKTVRIQGNHTLTTAHLTRLTRQGISHQLLGGNLLLLDTGSLGGYLQQAEPGIKQVTIHRQLPHTLDVVVVERQPTLNWKTGGMVYLLDATAAVIGPTDSTYAHLPTVTDSSNLPVKVGDKVAPPSFVTFCAAIARQLPVTGYTIQEMTVPESTNEVDVQTTGGLLLKFDTTRPAGEEIADLKAVQAELKAANQTPKSYIDLRIEDKAYYE
jgi:cell division protein FtsQ